jgi:protein involved in polysaccharide export with SLBB domain
MAQADVGGVRVPALPDNYKYSLAAFADGMRKDLQEAAEKGGVVYGLSPYTPSYSIPGSSNSPTQYNITQGGRGNLLLWVAGGLLALLLIVRR